MKLSLYLSEQSIGYQISLLQKIGSCQADLQQFEASISSYRKALELVEKSYDEQNEKFISYHTLGAIMHNIATSYEKLNNLKEAIQWYNKSIDMMQKSQDWPAKNYSIAKTLNSIGTCYQELGEFQKALDEYYVKAREKLQGDDQDTRILKSWLFDNEGLCYYGLGDNEKALEAFENALALKDASAEDMPHTLNNIANVLSVQGKHKEAIDKYKESLEKARENSGQDAKSVDIAGYLHNIGKEYLFLKDYQESGKWLREALSMKQSIYGGTNHPETSSTLFLIGVNYREQGYLEKAKKYLKQAYDMILTCEGNNDGLKSIIKRILDEVEEKLRKN